MCACKQEHTLALTYIAGLRLNACFSVTTPPHQCTSCSQNSHETQSISGTFSINFLTLEVRGERTGWGLQVDSYTDIMELTAALLACLLSAKLSHILLIHQQMSCRCAFNICFYQLRFGKLPTTDFSVISLT